MAPKLPDRTGSNVFFAQRRTVDRRPGPSAKEESPMMRMLTRAILVGAMGLVAGGAIGCAQERAPINRVQPDALAKSFFVGPDLESITDDPEFYMRGTLIDVGYGASQTGLFTSTFSQ